MTILEIFFSIYFICIGIHKTYYSNQTLNYNTKFKKHSGCSKRIVKIEYNLFGLLVKRIYIPEKQLSSSKFGILRILTPANII